MTDSPSDIYDVLVIGAGCAGTSAAMYAARFGLKVLMLGELPGGTITQTHVVENYPGFESITGLELGERLLHHAQACGAELKMERVLKMERSADGLFRLTTDSEAVYRGRTLIAATGSEYKKLGAPGEKEYANRGVHYCALCDGAFYKNQVIAVAGSGDSAAKEALLLAEYGSHVYIFVRGDKLKCEPIHNARVAANPKITVFSGVEIKEVMGAPLDKRPSKMTHLRLSKPCAPMVRQADGHLTPGEPTDRFPADGLFVLIGQTPASQWAEALGVARDAKGQIKVDRQMRTNVPGLFAAGDVNDSAFKQAIVSAADGVVAAYSAYHLLQDHKP